MPNDIDNSNKKGLILPALCKFGLGFTVMGALLFLCAGDIRYWNAWLYLVSLAVPMLLTGVYLYTKDPGLLRKRLNMNEREKKQKVYILVSALVLFAAFGLPGLDHRFGWSSVPTAAVFAALVVMLAGYGLFVLVMMQNSYASRVVEIQAKQKVIDTGVYAVVRHPMYLATLLLFLASPIVLGSYYSVLPMLIYPAVLVLRIKNEEEVLKGGLDGYAGYMKKVKYRLIPFIW